MGFKPAFGIKGRVFIPEDTPTVHKKHACPDCYQCQQCSDDRCQICRSAEEYPAHPKIGPGFCCQRDGKPQAVPEG